MIIGVTVALFALAMVVYLGGRIDLSYLEEEATGDTRGLGVLKFMLRQSDGGDGGEGQFSKDAVGRNHRPTASPPR